MSQPQSFTIWKQWTLLQSFQPLKRGVLMVVPKNRLSFRSDEKKDIINLRQVSYVRLEGTNRKLAKQVAIHWYKKFSQNICKENGLNVVKTILTMSNSGTFSLTRPAFQEMRILRRNHQLYLDCDLSRLTNYIEMGRLIDKVFHFFLGVRTNTLSWPSGHLAWFGREEIFEVEIKNLVNDLYSKDISKEGHFTRIHQGKVVRKICAFYGTK